MLLKPCTTCSYGNEKDGYSHCSREAVYSHLSNCIQKKALEYYLEHEAVEAAEAVSSVE